MLEKDLHLLTVKYLQKYYPRVIFRTDFSSGMKLSSGMARRHESLQFSKGYPDLFIAEPRKGFAGLFIEIKTLQNVLYKKDGTLRKNEHHEQQAAILKMLSGKGYKAEFGQGLNNIIKIINEYLNG